jgi:inosine-uridine nucleoside N-ribohydrolase
MAAEFNILNDPESARIVFKSGLPITLVSLDVTTKKENIFTSSHLSKIENTKTEISGFVGRIVRHCMKVSRELEHINGCYLHDPLAIAIAIDEDIICKTEQIYVDVETRGEITLGKTQADLRKGSKRLPNIFHCVRIDSKRFLDMVTQILSS